MIVNCYRRCYAPLMLGATVVLATTGLMQSWILTGTQHTAAEEFETQHENSNSISRTMGSASQELETRHKDSNIRMGSTMRSRKERIFPDKDDVKDSEETPSLSPPSPKFMNITLGVVANEFFDPTIGRTGGFGMATNMLGKFFARHPELGVKVVFIFSSPNQGNKESNLKEEVHHKLLGWPMISMVWDKEKSAEALQQVGIDVLLTIDYRNDYDRVIKSLPGVPIILWARDPRTNKQIENLEGIRLPKSMHYDEQPQGVTAPLATKALNIIEKREGHKRSGKMVMGVVWMAALRDRLYDAYHIPPSGNAFELPNVVEGDQCRDGPLLPKSEKPAVIFMGRLDPYKRPWLLVELAKKFPSVEFWTFGRKHFDGPGSYDITKDSGPLPDNVKLFGQLTGDEKWERFQKAWFSVSLSAHEGLAINYLEALQCGTPVLSTVNPGGVVSSYGIFAGEYSGSGEQGLPKLEESFQRLLDDEELRQHLGNEGRQVEDNSFTSFHIPSLLLFFLTHFHVFFLV